jgi:hypothetical protein
MMYGEAKSTKQQYRKKVAWPLFHQGDLSGFG